MLKLHKLLEYKFLIYKITQSGGEREALTLKGGIQTRSWMEMLQYVLVVN